MYEEPVEPEVRNYYADLGVSDEAEEDDIKAAYRRLVLRHHPDKKVLGQAIDATEFRKVQEAYEVLRYESTRRTYHDGEYQVWPRYWRARDIFELHEDEQRQQEAERATKAAQRRDREKDQKRQTEQLQRKKNEREAVERRHQEQKWQLRVDREDARRSAIAWENDMHQNALVARTVVIDEQDRCLCEGCVARRWREDDELLAPLPSMHYEERVKFLQWRAKEAELRAAQRAREEQDRQAKERLEKEKQKEAAHKKEEAAQEKKQAAPERQLNCFNVSPKLSSFITIGAKKLAF